MRKWLFVTGLELFACGGDHLDLEKGATIREPVLAGATNITDGVSGFPHSQEAETAGAIDALGRPWISYNAGDPTRSFDNPLVPSRIICRGSSVMGYSVGPRPGFSGDNWGRFRIETPKGIARLWGDPAMTQIGQPGRDVHSIFISNLAVPDDPWNANQTSQCDGHCSSCLLWDTTMAPTPTASICVAEIRRVGIKPFPSGRIEHHTFKGIKCLLNSLEGPAGENDFHDGTAMAATSTHVFVASRNPARSIGTDLGDSVDVWRRPYPQGGFVQLPRPPMPVDHNPILVANSNKLFVIDDRNRVLSVAAYDDLAESWSDPVTIASGLADPSPTLTNCAGIRQSGPWTAAILPASGFGPERIVVWYAVPGSTISCPSSPRFMRLQGTLCSTSPLACDAQPIAITPDGSNAFMPVVKSFTWVDPFFPFLGPVVDWHLSYWSDRDLVLGNVKMRDIRSKFQRSIIPGLVGQLAQQIPCPTVRDDYWGDYDGAVVLNNGTFSPAVLRAFTDSSESVNCLPLGWSQQDHQHVSVVQIPVGLGSSSAQAQVSSVTAGSLRGSGASEPEAASDDEGVSGDMDPVEVDEDDSTENGTK